VLRLDTGSAVAVVGHPIHAGIGLLFLLSNVLRLAAGFVSPRRVIDLRLTRLWLDYTTVTGLVALSLVLALPALVAMLEARP
jgi:cytochrome c oxidase subunit I+III